eukprot:scaffold30005_cov66-Phaeocystis_antarctica.AAC.4
MEDEHLDVADRGHGRLARLVGQQAVLLEHGLVQAGPVVADAALEATRRQGPLVALWVSRRDAQPCRAEHRWRAEPEALQKRAARGGADFVPVVAPLRAADLSLYDDEKGVAGLALLDQHGAVFELLQFECLGDGTPLEEGHLCAPN